MTVRFGFSFFTKEKSRSGFMTVLMEEAAESAATTARPPRRRDRHEEVGAGVGDLAFFGYGVLRAGSVVDVPDHGGYREENNLFGGVVANVRAST